MPVAIRRSVVTSHSAETIFATLCDLRAAPCWLPNCTAIELVDSGPVAAGTRLRYSYRELGHAGTLPCVVAVHLPPQRIAIEFVDARFDASIEFSITQVAGVTTIIHTVELTPKSLAVRILAAMMRRMIPARMDAALRGIEHAAASRSAG